jgi:hypothetical protein
MIRDIALKINELSRSYRIGKLQDIRKEIKKFDRKPGSDIFTNATISEWWAFHHGGRKELQFNIGFEEKEGFRYGLALSLEASHTVPDISILFPKAKRLNQFIRQNPDFFNEYKMWNHHEDERSGIGPVVEISDGLLKPHTFIFLGKLQPEEKIDFKKVLETFDDLLKPYIFVEKSSESNIIDDEIEQNNEFIFNAKNRNLPKHREYSLEERSVNLSVRHSLIQEALIKKLQEKYGIENVSPENRIGSKAIDVVVKKEDDFIFY